MRRRNLAMAPRHCVVRPILPCALLLTFASLAWSQNLIKDPSLETPKDPDQFGIVFRDWGGWIYEKPAKFAVGRVARSGRYSCEMISDLWGKIRTRCSEVQLEPGRYRTTVYLRGLDVHLGQWKSPIDFYIGIDPKWYTLKKNGQPLAGTFGWTPVMHVFDVPPGNTKPFQLFVGLVMTAGRLWVDDASLEKVDQTVALTPEPVVGEEEKPIVPPGALAPNAVHCADCGYLNNPDWGACYVCGAEIKPRERAQAGGPSVVVFADFEAGKTAPFGEGSLETNTPIDGKASLRLDKDWAVMPGPLDWSQYDYLHFDVLNPQDKPVILLIEIRDAQTKGYWTRVNLNTLIPPGKSTVTLPTDLYVGEKSRPGRPLMREAIERFIVNVGGQGPLIFDDFRLERLDTSSVTFPELLALDFGTIESPVMEGFSRCVASMAYAAGRGYGWTSASFWRAFNVLQPEALSQDFICPHSGVFRIDLPNGKYHVAMTIDSPNGYWGEVQVYRNRQVVANGQTLVNDSYDYQSFKRWYFRNAHKEDMPGVDPFDAYIQPMISARTFPVEVTDGKLELQLKGESWAICLSSLVVYPDAKAAQGAKFLDWVAQRRRAQVASYFKQLSAVPAGAAAPAQGYRLFARHFMRLPGPLDGPEAGEEIGPGGLSVTVARGEEMPLVFCVQSSGDLGPIDVSLSPFKGADGRMLDGQSLRPGWIDYRITRVTMDGTVYSVQPRYWHPTPAPAALKTTRTFWIRVKPPDSTPPGQYSGTITVKPAASQSQTIPATIRVLPFTLDPITDVAVGPWGCGINLPWYGSEPETQAWNWSMFERGLEFLRDAGCTSFSGRPTLQVKAAQGKIELDTTTADREMELIRAKGFTHLISSYGSSTQLGYRLYGYESGPDETAAKNAGFADMAAFLSALWKAVDEHAVAANWPPVAWNICDEPVDAAIAGAAKNAQAHREAAKGLQRTTFMGASSMRGADPNDPHYALVTALPIASLNNHDEAAIGAIKQAGNRFSFYNSGNRWTLGRYMKMLVAKHNMALRLTWHYNVVAGDPYYALDCREDDYCWVNTDEQGTLVPSLQFLANVLPGLNDYRYLSTLERLLKERPNHPAAAQARQVLDEMLNLEAGTDMGVYGQRKANRREEEYEQDRAKVAAAIEALVK